MTTQHEPTELKPCPFCGSEPILLETNERRPDQYQRYVTVRCDECGIEMGEEFEHEIIAAWNTRAMQSATAPSEDVVELLQENEALRQALAKMHNERAADTLERLAAEVLRLTEDKRRLEARLCETQMLLVSCGNHDALAEKAKTWPEVKRAFADRCLECGGLHGPSSGCMGPPMPSVPHPHAGKMQG
jgi:Lar family restriction alleviation protein